MSSTEPHAARRIDATRQSAIWAAYGDALGFISEMAPTPAALGRRIGRERVDGLVSWQRRVGGKFGVEVELPAGSYSDDTQLRLATARAILGSGRFDVESFSKIELPVFLAYQLGAGRGTRKAAAALGKRAVRWSNNFYKQDGDRYVDGGGNGAAMRVQPHVWASSTLAPETFLGDVFTNAISTHGHPRGFVGACWHAVVLARVFETGEIPDLVDQALALQSLSGLPDLVRDLPLVGDVWLPLWEQESRTRLEDSVETAINEAQSDIALVEPLSGDGFPIYRRVVERVGGLDPETRGSGMKTTLLAGVLAYLFRDDPAAGMLTGANVLGSDTDTIASMAGALLGAAASEPPPELPADNRYIVAEAERLAAVAAGASGHGFAYPDLLKWHTPKAQLDSVGALDGGLAVVGLGPAKAHGEPISPPERKQAVWQWLDLWFGQRILVRRRDAPRPVKRELLPGAGHAPAVTEPLFTQGTATEEQRGVAARPRLDLDAASRQAINSGFDPTLIGRLLVNLADTQGVDFAVAFAAIIAKARVARRRRPDKDGSST